MYGSCWLCLYTAVPTSNHRLYYAMHALSFQATLTEQVVCSNCTIQQRINTEHHLAVDQVVIHTHCSSTFWQSSQGCHCELVHAASQHNTLPHSHPMLSQACHHTCCLSHAGCANALDLLRHDMYVWQQVSDTSSECSG